MLGGGVCGLATRVLLSRDGHDVEVWERDATAPPASIDKAWEDWDKARCQIGPSRAELLALLA